MLEVTQLKDHLFVYTVKNVIKMPLLYILICKVTIQVDTVLTPKIREFGQRRSWDQKVRIWENNIFS